MGEEGGGRRNRVAAQLDWLMFGPKAVRFVCKWGARKKDQPKKVAICFPQVFFISMACPSALLPPAVCQTYFIFIYNNLITAKWEAARGRERLFRPNETDWIACANRFQLNSLKLALKECSVRPNAIISGTRNQFAYLHICFVVAAHTHKHNQCNLENCIKRANQF